METWYPPTSDIPGLGIRVLVQWAGRQFAACRYYDKDVGQIRWATFEKGQRVNLPPKGQEADFGYEPQAWRPEKPDLWKADLPEPLTSCEPRMWSSRTKFQAVEEASAEELAREMEADRADAQRGCFAAENGAAAARAQMRDRQWWRDGTLISYSQPGSISKQEAEGRMMRALAWCGAGSGLTLRERTPLTILAAISDFMDGMEDERASMKFDPLPQDAQDFEVAMGWFVRLYPLEMRGKHAESWDFSTTQKVLLWRSRAVPLSFDQIGRLLAISESAARQRVYGGPRYVGALERVWRAANGWKVWDHLTVADQVVELRKRNRLARISEARG